MKPVLHAMILVFGILLGAWPGLANEAKPKPFIGPSDGPTPDLLCADPASKVDRGSKEARLYRVSCHEKHAQPCSPSPETLRLQDILQQLGSAKAISVRWKTYGCYEFIFVHWPKS